MAQTVHLSFPIVKSESTADGDVVVYGCVSDGSVDADHQIVDPGWCGKALKEWLSTGGNMRVQHSPFLYPAGRGLALEIDKDGSGAHWLRALVVEDNAKNLVRKGVLRDFSVGIVDPQLSHGDYRAPMGTIKGGRIGEVSLVDRGSNKNSHFTIAKSVGGVPVAIDQGRQFRKFVKKAFSDPRKAAQLLEQDAPVIYKGLVGSGYAGPADAIAWALDDSDYEPQPHPDLATFDTRGPGWGVPR